MKNNKEKNIHSHFWNSLFVSHYNSTIPSLGLSYFWKEGTDCRLTAGLWGVFLVSSLSKLISWFSYFF